jgi:amino acid transporter
MADVKMASTPTKAGFGTMAVFLTAISTILGAVLFLRFGYAVGNVGFLGTVLIIAIGHMVTIPTAMAVAEIATNQKVEGGGKYYILSRSFGLDIGATIGVFLFLSQAISVAFYVIAFGELAEPAFGWMNGRFGWDLTDKRLVSVPVTGILTWIIIRFGAGSGMKLLYVVCTVLFLSLISFFMGQAPGADASFHRLLLTVEDPDPLFKVFAIIFPAFTGMTAGVGLSGDLRDPKRAIPLGTLAATWGGMVVYLGVAWKLAASATPDALAADQLIMGKIAIWGPLVYAGLAAATISSAIGSYLIAPRTLQAMAGDRVFPAPGLNRWLARSAEGSAEPVNASIITGGIAMVFVLMGDVNFVAQIISMFFMVTYGAVCLVSFLEHFAADPSYRPTFRSRWYISLFGAVMCVWVSFQMSPLYASLAISLMFMMYLAISHVHSSGERDLSYMFRGAVFQLSRQLQVFLQKSQGVEELAIRWRPSVVCISSTSFDQLAAFDLLRWVSHRYGFGTYLHYIDGYLSRSTNEEAKDSLQRLVRLANVSGSNVFVDTLVSPSYTSAVAQVIQLPGVSGKENNTVLFEFSRENPTELVRILENFQLASSMDFDVWILGSSKRAFGYHREIHVWITPEDYDNSGLMILVAYMLLGHPDWKRAQISISCILPADDMASRTAELHELIHSGRLPISDKNVEILTEEAGRRRDIIREGSRNADLVIVGFRGEAVNHQGTERFEGYDGLANVLFVNTRKEIDLIADADAPPVVEEAPTKTRVRVKRRWRRSSSPSCGCGSGVFGRPKSLQSRTRPLQPDFLILLQFRSQLPIHTRMIVIEPSPLFLRQ